MGRRLSPATRIGRAWQGAQQSDVGLRPDCGLVRGTGTVRFAATVPRSTWLAVSSRWQATCPARASWTRAAVKGHVARLFREPCGAKRCGRGTSRCGSWSTHGNSEARDPHGIEFVERDLGRGLSSHRGAFDLATANMMLDDCEDLQASLGGIADALSPAAACCCR